MFDIPGAARLADVVFQSPELIQKRQYVPCHPVVKVDVDKYGGKGYEEEIYNSDNDDYHNRKVSVHENESQHRFSTDCCECNIHLRRDIDRLKTQITRLDQQMTNNMAQILVLLERSVSQRTSERKTGYLMTQSSSHNGTG